MKGNISCTSCTSKVLANLNRKVNLLSLTHWEVGATLGWRWSAAAGGQSPQNTKTQTERMQNNGNT